MKMNHIFAITLLAALTSCAQMPRGSHQSPLKEFAFDPYKSLGIKTSRVEELIEKTKKSGDKNLMAFASRDFYLKGNDASIRGDFQLAIYYFKAALQLTSDDLFIQRKLAYDLIRTGELSASKEYLENIYAKTSPKDEVVGQLLATVYSSMDLKHKAISLYKELLVANPHAEESCLYLSRMYVAEKKYDEVNKLIAKCNSGEQKYPSLVFFQGKVAYEKKDKVLAKKYFEEAMRIDATYSQAALAIGALYEEAGKFNEALKFYKSYVSEEDTYYDTQIINRIIIISTNQNKTKDVIAYSERLLANDAADLNVRVKLGLLYSDEKRYDEAIDLFKGIVNEVPDSDKIRYYLGALYQQTQKFHEAIAQYNIIKSDSPLYGDAGIQIGQMLSFLSSDSSGKIIPTEEVKFSIFIQERAKEIPELSVEFNMIQATFYEEAHEFDKAIKALDSVKNHKNYSDQHRYYHASMLERVGKVDEARTMIKAILAKDENNPHALNFLGYSYLDRNENMDEAFRLISKAVELRPEDGYIRDSIAWYYYKVGKYEEALKEATKAYKLVSSDPTITKHLGMIYIELDQFDKAHKYLTMSLDKTKATDERDDVLKLLTDIQQKRLPASRD